MYQFKSDGNDQVFQRHAENQHTGLFQAAPVSYVMNTVPNLAFEMPQPPSGSAFPVYEDMYKCMQQRWMYSLSGIPAQVRQDNMQTLPHVPITRTNDSPAESMNSQYGLNSYVTTKVPGKTLKKTGSGREAGAGYGMAVTGDETDTGSVAAGDLAICQLGNPTSRLMKAESGVGSQKPVEDALQRRELRLLKNREAARECRRKKKEYVRCLENRVAVLEQQNKTLIEELRALKYIYRHKAE